MKRNEFEKKKVAKTSRMKEVSYEESLQSKPL